MKNANAVVHWAGGDYFVGVPPSGHALTLDINGERSNAAGPLELLLVALGGCTGADVISVLKKKREQVTAYRVEVHGERREEYPKGFRKFEVRHILRGRGLSADNVAKAIELSTNKYCSVAATVRPAAEIVTSFEIQEESTASA
ncbi:MAG TPA: OsmC family protein [Bryobacteraceae bacterium]|nr:OsmC family protein [Bryobacteraceae bacterium]